MDDWFNNIKMEAFRRTCPDSLTLVAFYEGRVGRDRHAELQRHLSVCHHCGEELTLLHKGYLSETKIDLAGSDEASWIGRLLEHVTAHIAVLLPTPVSAAALRGRPARTFENERWRTRLTIQADRLAPDKRLLRGQIDYSSGHQDQGAGEINLILWPETEFPQPVPLDAQHNFTVTGINPGNYRLIIVENGRQAHLLFDID